ncbi:hypothetical protein P3342_000330 [Pyrenophora teres f. teres]|uniref:Uncharacterized protein n=1 Tax=Pyrenophora teres f. teres TaxID=97479 RepID=A0A6S6V5B9_9PLEO|nr:hypothetical protein HRS9139_04570 [Pyrenophora teres f. teres]KAE8837556.1 hypothetical protein PTNB85_04891 [Pyrenophora teres f. teres]KAE8862382.1 hypothetical protein PTNB29_04944 [Pyrenophora teres f. teres]KAE8869378.1 hypothetical protein PTNB73_04431 [Pyrenophora teres f. teres]KAK1917617.1 hypothetical protein P3342_000330 [Pyrenophora teres f. teres]
MTDPNSSNAASSTPNNNKGHELRIALFLGFHHTDISSSGSWEWINEKTYKGSAYEEYKKYFGSECPVLEKDFDNTKPMKGDSMWREVVKLELEGAEDLRYTFLPASFAEIDTPEVLNSYGRACEEIGDISALQQGERWTHLWQFFRNLRESRIPSPSQAFTKDDESIVESYSDTQETATRSPRVPPWDKARTSVLQETCPDAATVKDRGWGIRENAYTMLFFTMIRNRGRENHAYIMPSAQQVADALNRFFQRENPDYAPRTYSAMGSFYRHKKRSYIRSIKEAADALATKGAGVFIPEITTARLDTYIAQEEWAEEEAKEETDEDTYEEE